MYRLTSSASNLPPPPPSSSTSTADYSRSHRARSPLSENPRRARSPAMQNNEDPLAWSPADIQKSQPFRLDSYRAGTRLEVQESRRSADRSARSVSPMRCSSPRPPAHIRAQTPPAKRGHYDMNGFLTPPTDGSEFPPAPRTPPRSPLVPTSQLANPSPSPSPEPRGRIPSRGAAGLREGMSPGPNFFEHAERRTKGLRVVTSPLPPPPSAPSPPPKQPAIQKAATEPVAPKPRRAVPSMCDYLSLEQLETLWNSQDLYKGTIEAPLSRPRFSPVERAKILAARAQLGDLPVHPAFRKSPSISG